MSMICTSVIHVLAKIVYRFYPFNFSTSVLILKIAIRSDFVLLVYFSYCFVFVLLLHHILVTAYSIHNVCS